MDKSGLVGSDDYYHLFGPNTKEIIVDIDFANAGFDRQPVPFNFGNQHFKIKQGNLYKDDGRVQFRLSE